MLNESNRFMIRSSRPFRFLSTIWSKCFKTQRPQITSLAVNLTSSLVRVMKRFSLLATEFPHGCPINGESKKIQRFRVKLYLTKMRCDVSEFGTNFHRIFSHAVTHRENSSVSPSIRSSWSQRTGDLVQINLQRKSLKK